MQALQTIERKVLRDLPPLRTRQTGLREWPSRSCLRWVSVGAENHSKAIEAYEVRMKERTQLIKDLHAQGKSAKEIAIIAGCCISNVYYITRRLNLKLNKVSEYKKPSKKRDKIFVLHRTGMMSSKIAKELNCSLQYVSRTLIDAGLKPNNSCPVCALDLSPKPGLRIMRAG